MERKLWLQTRRTGIGGSDAAAILGLSPWKSAMDVWLDKRGLTGDERPDPDKEFLFELGQLMEPVITGLYEKRTGHATRAGELVRHKNAPVLLGTPDRICIDVARGVELKTENQFSDQFGNEGTDEIPHQYLIQCAHYMAVTDLPVWDVAVLHGGARFATYTVERDADLEEYLIDSLLGWWEAHIVRGVPPDMDSSDAWRVYIHKKHPQELLPMVPLEPEHHVLIERLAQTRQAENVMSALRTELESKLKSIIGDHLGVTSPYGKITWKKTKDSKVVDWQGAYYALRQHTIAAIAARGPTFKGAADELAKLADACIATMETTRPGVRRFLFTPTGEEHGRNNVTEIGAGRVNTPSLPANSGNSGDSSGDTSQSSNRSPVRDGGEASS
jgi:putative phage-type endonuclease